MSEWRSDVEKVPIGATVLVAYHGHGENHVSICTRVKQRGMWGDWDYINSHDGEPKYWMPVPEAPNDIAGPDCGCDGCTEQYCGDQLPAV